MEGRELLKKLVLRFRIQKCAHKISCSFFISDIRIGPAGKLLGFANRLQHVALNPLAEVWPILAVQRFKRPRADKSLVEKIFVVACWCRLAIQCAFFASAQLSPTA